MKGGARLVLRNRRFLALCCAYGAYLLAYNQLYLALPAEVERAAGSQAPLAWLFALSSLLVVTAQLPVTRWAGERLARRRSMVTGLVLIAVGFAVVGLARPAGWTGTGGLLPAAGFVVLLTLGQMLVAPVARAWVPDLAEDGRLGLYTGALSSVSGLIVLALQLRDRPPAGHRPAGHRAVAGAGRRTTGGGGDAAPVAAPGRRSHRTNPSTAGSGRS